MKHTHKNNLRKIVVNQKKITVGISDKCAVFLNLKKNLNAHK